MKTGDWLELPDKHWRFSGAKGLEWRFHCLRFDRSDPFATNSFHSDAGWLFLERESLDRVLANLRPPELPSRAPAAALAVLDRRLPSKAILEFLLTRADGNTPEHALRKAAAAHFEAQGKGFTDERWRKAWSDLPAEKKLPRGQKPKPRT